MRAILIRATFLVMAFLLVGCAPTQAVETDQPGEAEATLLAAVPSQHPVIPTPTPQPTLEIQSCIEQACVLDGHFFLQIPIPDRFNQSITGNYRFGSTLEGDREIHHGVEFSNPSGTPVLAAADGKVVFAGNDARTTFGLNTNFYGNLVILEHHMIGIVPPIFTLYAHLSDVNVLAGDDVTVGQQIGSVGSSGSAQGSHLHFEVRLRENTYQAAVNPELWLTLTPDKTSAPYGALAGVIQNSEGEVVRVTNIRLEYSPIQGGSVEDRFTLSTYYDESLSSDPTYHENFVISGLTPGWYRFVTVAYGTYSSKWVQIEPGKLTFINIPVP
jgi:hypothetical protein